MLKCQYIYTSITHIRQSLLQNGKLLPFFLPSGSIIIGIILNRTKSLFGSHHLLSLVLHQLYQSRILLLLSILQSLVLVFQYNICLSRCDKINRFGANLGIQFKGFVFGWDMVSVATNNRIGIVDGDSPKTLHRK